MSAAESSSSSSSSSARFKPAATPVHAAVIRMPSAARVAAGEEAADPFRDMQQHASQSAASAHSDSDLSTSQSEHGALHRSLQALSDTLAHTQSTQREQERIMQQKLLAKGKKIAEAVSVAPSPSTTGTAASAPAPAPSASCSSSSSSALAPPAPSKIIRIGNSKPVRRVVRFAGVDEGDEPSSSDDDEQAGSITAHDAAYSIINAQAAADYPTSNPRSAASDFDLFLARQWGNAVSSAAASKAGATSAAASAAKTPDQVPSSIRVDPVALSSFLHFRAPLSAPRIPSLQMLCCSALSALAQSYPLADRPEQFEDLAMLPSQLLEACIEGVKRPRVIVAGSAAAIAAEAAAALLDPDPLDRARNARPALADSQLLPFLAPQLDSFALEAEGSDAIGGGLAGLPDQLACQISPLVIDALAERCLALQHLNLAGYIHSFSAAQLTALARLTQLLSLNVSHCKLLGGEIEVLTQGMTRLRCCNLSWTSFVTEESGGMAPLSTLVALVARPALRLSLRALKVDGLRADPNELLWRLLEVLGSSIEEIGMDSVAPPANSMSRAEEEAARRRAREAAAATAAAAEQQQLECEKAAAAIEQLQSENAKLKAVFEMQLRVQREAAAAAQQQNLQAPDSASTGAAGRFPALHTLSAIASDRLSSESLLLLMYNAPSLTSLTLKGASLLTSAVVQALARDCRLMQHLNVADCQALNDQALWALREAADPRAAAAPAAAAPVALRRARNTQGPGVAMEEDHDDAEEEEEKKHGEDPFPAVASLPALFSSSSSSSVPGSFLRSVDFSWDESLSNSAIGALFDTPSAAVGGSASAAATTVSALPYCPLVRPSDVVGSGCSRRHFGLERVVLSCLEDLDEHTVSKLAKHRGLRELDLSRCLGLNASAMLQAEWDEEESPDDCSASASSSSSSSSSSLPPSLSLPLAWSALQKLNLSWTAVTNSDLGLVARRCPRLQHLNVEGCKHLTDGCVDEMLAAESDGCCVLYNLSYLSFFFVNALTLRGIVTLLAAHRGYWLSVKDYYGDVHDPSTLEHDALEAKSSNDK